MATAEQLAQLDEAHRAQQAANAGALVLALNSVWSQVQSSSLATTGTAWLTEAIALIASRRRLSTLYALDYSRRIRALQVGLDDLPAVLASDFPTLIKEWETTLGGRAAGRKYVELGDLPSPPAGIAGPNLDQIRESLIHVGLRTTAINLSKIPDQPETPGITDTPGLDQLEEQLQRSARQRQMHDQAVREEMQSAQARIGYSAVKLVQNGGRDAVDSVINNDLKARGYIRITRPGCCYFCAMLASRGPVYSKDSFDASNKLFKNDPRDDHPGDAKVHDSCGCGFRAVYTRDGSEWTTVARESSDIWEQIRQAKNGATPTINEFRTRWGTRNASMQ